MPASFGHTVYVWTLNWSNYLNKRARLWQVLSPEEQKKSRQFVSYYDQDKYIVIRGVLRILIGHLIGVSPQELTFEYNRFGKPKLVNSFLEFNLSYARHQVVYAFCQNASLGIDIEYQSNIVPIEKIAKRYFSTTENEILSTLKKNKKRNAFFTGWTQKEAIVKALGMGLQIPLTKVEVFLETLDSKSIRYTLTSCDPSEEVVLYPIKISKEFKCFLAIQTNQTRVTFQIFKEMHLF